MITLNKIIGEGEISYLSKINLIESVIDEGNRPGNSSDAQL